MEEAVGQLKDAVNKKVKSAQENAVALQSLLTKTLVATCVFVIIAGVAGAMILLNKFTAGFEKLLPSQISGGMKKRVALARAIALDPKIVFYDEPSAGLDPITASMIDQLILDLSRKLEITSVVVTHEMKSAFRIADQMVVLHRGKVVAEGDPETVKQSANPYVRQFIHGEHEGAIPFRQSGDAYLKGLLEP
jgi:ABC-type transporter Mla maintaining outer membrane lipid asymmetry ATPase subunit MlaF